MNFIPITQNENGSYRGARTCDGALPQNHAIIPDTLDMADFYAYNGFVVLTIEDDVVTGYEPNIEAWEAWKASLPEPTDPPIDDVTALQLAVVELAETQENYQTANELALAELAELMMGG